MAKWPVVLLAVTTLLAGTDTWADWEDGRVPEGSNAFTVHRHELRLNLIGRSAFGLTDHLELTSYLPVVIFPNVGLKYRFLEREDFALAWEADLGVGLLPLGVAFALPLPGAVVGGGAIGVLIGSVQLLELHASWKWGERGTLSFRGGGFAAEGAFLGVGAAAAAGGGGVGAQILPLSLGGSVVGGTAGAEADVVLGAHDALLAEADAAAVVHGQAVLFLASASWIHAWEHVHLQLGAYTLTTLGGAGNRGSWPVGPFVNVFWTFNRPEPTAAP